MQCSLQMRWAIFGLLAACSAGSPEPPASIRPPRPPGAPTVTTREDLQARIDATPAGAALCLAPGVHQGPIRLTKPCTLWGPPTAVIRSKGRGSTVDVASGRVSLLGFTVDGSGNRFDLTDAAVRVRADEVQVIGLTIQNALFGILVEKSKRVLLRGNRVFGNAHKHLGMRGDGIRLWETRDSTIEQNRITDSRDLVVWYSSRNRILHNTIERSRYGTHLMYSHDNELGANRYLANVVGIFLMYSHGVKIHGNLFARSRGAGGMGIGFKESGDIAVLGNRFLGDTMGIYLDNSPLDLDRHNRFSHNLLAFCDTAVVFHGVAKRSSFRDNTFVNNVTQVRVDGGGNALEVAWTGNDFDDYRGYDLDGDGKGDVPYELRSFSGDLIGRHPGLAFFRGMPVLSMIDFTARAMPLFEPRKILVDRAPAMRSLPNEVDDAR